MAPISAFANEDTKNMENNKIAEIHTSIEEEEENIVIELNAEEIVNALESYGIDENSTEVEIEKAIDDIIVNTPELFAQAIPDGGGMPSKPSIGQTKNVTVKVSNNDIFTIAGSSIISKSVLSSVFKKLTSYFVPLGKLGELAGAVATVNSATGYSGFQYTVSMTYKKTVVFDGQHVEYTGWHVTGYSGFKRYK